MSDRGQFVLSAIETLGREYGDDALFWAIDRIKARRAAKRRRARDRAIEDVRESAEERKRRGDGQP